MTCTSSMPPAVRDFWAEFLAQTDDPDDAEARFFEAFKVGDTQDAANEGARLILSGAKTATSSLLWDYEAAGTLPPAEGAISIVMNGRNEPVCVVETTWLAVLPFAEADEQFARDYGEWDGTLATWREKCWAYYSKGCEVLGRLPSQGMPLLFERFRVIFHRSS